MHGGCRLSPCKHVRAPSPLGDQNARLDLSKKHQHLCTFFSAVDLCNGLEDAYPEIFNDSVYLDIRLVVTEGILKLLQIMLAKARGQKWARRSGPDNDQQEDTYLSADGIDT
jgi:hypothetical protein